MDHSVLVEIWDIFKAYIPKKELPFAAEQFMSYLYDSDIHETALSELITSCTILEEAHSNLSEEIEYELDDEEDEW
jgi:hypothetical protein